MTTQPTCEGRIDDQLKGRIDDLTAIQNGTDPDTGQPFEHEDDQYQRADDMVLSLDKRITVTVLLSCGGPSDSLVFHYAGEDDGTHEPDRIDYRYQDWYDGATRNLTGDDYQTALDAYGEHAYHTAYHQ